MTRPEELAELKAAIRRLETLADQTAVHRKKFEFALSQIRQFSHALFSSPSAETISALELDPLRGIKEKLQAVQELMLQHLLQTWSAPTIENPSNHVIDCLRDILGDLRRIASVLDAAAAAHLDESSPQWSRFNILDLRAIKGSFTQYLCTPDIDPELSRAIEARLMSLDRHLGHDPEPFSARTFSPIPVSYQSWRVNLSDFKEIREVGTGTSATVFSGHDKATGQAVAIKKFRFKRLNGAKLQSFQRESPSSRWLAIRLFSN
jgi:hypothetical protein